MSFEDTVTKRVLAELSTFEGANFKDPAVCTAMNSTTMMALVDIQDDHPAFDAKATFEYVPEVRVEVTWWEGMGGKHNKFLIRFNPLRVDKEKKDLYDAYDRAMSIL